MMKMEHPGGRAGKKPIPIQSGEYKLLLQSFKEWLALLGYSPLSIPVLVQSITHFLYFQESNNKTELGQLEASDGTAFIESIQQNKRISSGHINKQVQALKLFSKWIRETGRSNIGFTVDRMEEKRSKPTWLTKAEIQSLHDGIPETVLGMRDKAMLAVYYGCGLRLNEGACLEVTDIDTGNRLLHVRKGKRYRERFVPIAQKSYEAIQLYTGYGRPQLLQDTKTTALFIDANRGGPMQKQSLYVRIKQLARKAKLSKRIGTHTLRHSIATHLLQSGMKLERIAEFLGHANLDSTQIYTHLVNEPL